MPNREDAWQLLCEYTQSESLRKHALAVEACVRAYARKFASEADSSQVTSHSSDQRNTVGCELSAVSCEELWGITALLHDFDYERWPNTEHHPTQGHPFDGSKILRERGYLEELIRAILSHADYSGVPRQSPLEHTLYACDELAGFLTACALVQPTKSIHQVKVESVKKKLKDKAFAKGVNRDDVRRGAEELGLSLDDHIAFCLQAMQGAASALGLEGKPAAGASAC
ncbi:MAG: HD domain-containing protein [Candidatus Acidiferrales bacterium]